MYTTRLDAECLGWRKMSEIGLPTNSATDVGGEHKDGVQQEI